MRKISLKNVNAKSFTNLIKRSSSMDKMIFTTIKGSEFESVAYNKHATALKSVEADLEKICESYKNECGDEAVKVYFVDAGNLISSISIFGSNNVNITFDIDENNFAKRISFESDELFINVPCADSAAVEFLALSDERKAKVFDDDTNLKFSMGITNNEFSFIKGLFGLHKESFRVFFHKKDDEIYMSEVESTDENVRNEINDIINRAQSGDDDNAYEEFFKYEKMYCKKLTISNFENYSNDYNFLACFNKSYFPWIDDDKEYTFSFHKNRVKISSFDEEGCIKTTVVLAPVQFA